MSNLLNVKRRGVRGDGVTDDTAAIQAVWDEVAASTDYGGLFFPSGRYLISSTLNFYDYGAGSFRTGLKIIGEGFIPSNNESKTSFVWVGSNAATPGVDPDIPMINFWSRESLFEAIQFTADTGYTLDVAIDWSHPPTTGVLTQLNLKRCWFIGEAAPSAPGTVRQGLVIGSTAESTANLDFGIIEDCWFQNCVEYGVNNLNTSEQSKQWSILRSDFGTNKIDFPTPRGTALRWAGSFRCESCFFFNLELVADIYQPSDAISFSNLDVEQCKKLLIVDGPGSDFIPVKLEFVRMNLNNMDITTANYDASDVTLIEFSFPGFLTVADSIFSEKPGAPTTQVPMLIDLSHTADQAGAAVFTNCRFPYDDIFGWDAEPTGERVLVTLDHVMGLNATGGYDRLQERVLTLNSSGEKTVLNTLGSNGSAYFEDFLPTASDLKIFSYTHQERSTNDVTLRNISDTHPVVFAHDDGATGVAEERFICPRGKNFRLNPGQEANITRKNDRWYLFPSTTDNVTSETGYPYNDLTFLIDVQDRRSYPETENTVLDISPNMHGILTFNNTTSADGYWDFNGSSSSWRFRKASDVDDIFSGGGTVSLAFLPRSDGSLDEGRIVGTEDASSISGWSLSTVSEASGAISIRLLAGFDTTPGEWVMAGLPVVLDTWNALIVSYDSDSVANDPTFYLNGVQASTVENVTPVGAYASDSSQFLNIGFRTDFTRIYDGGLSLLSLHNRVLSSEERVMIFRLLSGRHGVNSNGLGYYGIHNNLQTADATPTVIAIIPTDTNKSTWIEATIQARDNTANESAYYKFTALYDNTAGTVTELDSVTVSFYEDDASWDFTLVVDATNVKINVVGDASNTVDWKILGNSSEI